MTRLPRPDAHLQRIALGLGWSLEETEATLVGSRRLTTRQAADYLGVHPGTLNRWSNQGSGPPRDFRGRYPQRWLERWEALRARAAG